MKSVNASLAQLLKYPFPYKAMISICSDLDETPDAETYFECIKYLNTNEKTIMGRGVNLEVGNSIYFKMPDNQFSYWNTDDKGRKSIKSLILSGHIDCIHSYGDFVTRREEVKEILEELKGYSLDVWIDHAQAITNFDSEIMEGQGANIKSSAYHADLTLEHGVSFVWKGRVTSVIAQNVKRSYAGIFSVNHPISSVICILKEFAKGVLGRFGNEKYRMHHLNRVMVESVLEDGSKVYEFMRSNPSFAGVSTNETAMGIKNVISSRVLNNLVRKEGCTILYTHLGKIGRKSEPFDEAARQAFELLSAYQANGSLKVTSTRKLLAYLRAKETLDWEASKELNSLTFYVNTAYLSDIGGLSWLVDRSSDYRIYINGEIYHDFEVLPLRDEKDVISIPWKFLEFPQLV